MTYIENRKSNDVSNTYFNIKKPLLDKKSIINRPKLPAFSDK